MTGTLLIGGDILLFLAPRMVPMVWFGLAVAGRAVISAGRSISSG